MNKTGVSRFSKCFWFGHEEERDLTPEWTQDYRVYECNRGKQHIEYIGDGEVERATEHPDFEKSKEIITRHDFKEAFEWIDCDISKEDRDIARKICDRHQMLWFHI